MSFFDRDVERRDPFSKVLFYSVLLHYIIFFILFGNPFLLLNDERPSGPGQSLEVRLLSAPKEDAPVESLRIPFPTASAEEQAARENLALTRDRGEDETQDDGAQETGAGNPARLPPAPANNAAIDAMGDLNVPSPLPAQPQKVVRKLPPNMTGPEDCLLKVVGMVCPDGSAECIEAYKDFCASLPK